MMINFLTDSKTIEAKPGDKLVELCERHGISVPFGCQNGNCATCLSTVLKGMEHLNVPSRKELNTLELFTHDKRHRLLCQCSVVSEGEIDIEH
jgi:ferredoxin